MEKKRIEIVRRFTQLQMAKINDINDIQWKQSETNRRTAENVTCKFKNDNNRLSSWGKLYGTRSHNQGWRP